MSHPSTMTVRRPRIAFPQQIDPVFVEDQPELSFLLLALSLSLPYAEPYMIRVMGKAKHRVTDGKLREAITVFNGQEAQHYRLHSRFNEATGVACPALAALEAELARDCEQRLATRSLKWNLAFIQGVEAFTVALARFMLEEDLLRDADPAVRDLFDWHNVEELEHRSVAFDTYEHLYGGYAYRIAVGAHAHRELCRFSLRAIGVLVERHRASGGELGITAQTWARLRALSSRISKHLLPKVLATYSPRYRPDQIGMPANAGAVLRRIDQRRLMRMVA